MPSTIPVIITSLPPNSDTKGILSRVGALQIATNVDLEQLKRNLSDLVAKLGQAIMSAQSAAGALTLTEVEVGIEITAEGGVALVGTLGATASMKLKFQRTT